MSKVLETVIYKPKPGISSAEALHKIETVMDPLLHKVGGLERIWRSTMADGTLVDTVLWADEAAYRRAEAATSQEPALGPIFALFDEQSLFMAHARVFE